jgi:hypothetical protein
MVILSHIILAGTLEGLVVYLGFRCLLGNLRNPRLPHQKKKKKTTRNLARLKKDIFSPLKFNLECIGLLSDNLLYSIWITLYISNREENFH